MVIDEAIIMNYALIQTLDQVFVPIIYIDRSWKKYGDNTFPSFNTKWLSHKKILINIDNKILSLTLDKGKNLSRN